MASVEYALALGRPEPYPEQNLRTTGVKPKINDSTWLLQKVMHSVNGSCGLASKLEMETAL